MSGGQKILIDGYNLIHASGELKRLLDRETEQARSALLDRLAAYLEGKRLQITVVFDGRGGLLDAEPVIPGKLQALFSRDQQTADQLILAILHESVNPREYLVVTSDNEDIGRNARRLGATVIDSPSFLARMRGRRPTPIEAQEKPAPSSDDTDYWLRKFRKKD